MEVTFDSNLAQFDGWIDVGLWKQLPFAGALALTNLARRVQGVVRADLPAHFTIRTGWVPRGIQFVSAKKADWPNASSRVGSRDAFMVLQETGGTKRPTKGSNLAIPTRGARRGFSNSGTIATNRRPRPAIASGFAIPEAQDIARARLGRNAVPLRILYWLRPSAVEKPRLGMRATAEQIVAAEYAPTFQAALAQAFKSRR